MTTTMATVMATATPTTKMMSDSKQKWFKTISAEKFVDPILSKILSKNREKKTAPIFFSSTHPKKDQRRLNKRPE